MKKIFIIFCVLCAGYIANAQTNVTNNPASGINPEIISLKETQYDFGKIPQGKPVTHIFLFTNTGNTPLALENVQASCGCTTPEWSKDAVPAGVTSKITVGYNAMNDGPFTKSITVTYNGNQTKQINIKGEVWKTPSGSAPENTGLNSLKNQ
ncbi:MAG: DUF1573 domain-containing protein [Bacteroidota bacterium]|nr:DUF1573 domain-containing protein [Bacteroidota bacterium]